MNLALHGFLLQVFLSIFNFHHSRLLCSAGEPGYLDFDNLPETNFSCQGKVIGGYYADVEAGCQMFHVCTIGQKDEIMDIKFLCLNGTVFDQETRVCERVDEVDCSKSERFYNLNLELYGNNAVTLSLHENGDDEDDLSDSIEDHQPRTTSARPSTTSTTSTTTSRPSKPSTTAASGSFQHPTGYPQHYQPQPPFPQIHTSQSKSLYDDKNGGYHHQYIFHSDERERNNQATSYQLFSNQGVSSTTVQPPPPPLPPQIHQIRFSSTVGPQIIHNEPSTVTPLYHATSSTIQTLLNSNANSPALINPIFHNHGIASTTEQFIVHSNNPRETSDYRDEDDHEQNVRPLEAIQSTNKGKVSKLSISPIPNQQESSRTVQTKTNQRSQQQRISGNFLSTPATIETTVRSFYPTPRPSPKPSQPQSQSITQQVTQHIHVSPGVTIPQLKPHQITINLSPPDIQRIIQNPSPLLPSQSRVIVTAKASVSDESGRPLNTTQLVTLPLPTIPASYDDYKEGDESFDPFYRDVPKIHKIRRVLKNGDDNVRLVKKKRKRKRSLDQTYRFVYDANNRRKTDSKESEFRRNADNAANKKKAHAMIDDENLRAIKDSFMSFRDILYSDKIYNVDSTYSKDPEEIESNTDRVAKENDEIFDIKSIKQTKDNTIRKFYSLEDLKTEAAKHLDLHKEENTDVIEEKENDDKTSNEDLTDNKTDSEEIIYEEERINGAIKPEAKLESEIIDQTTARFKETESQDGVIDVIILDSLDNTTKSLLFSSDDVKASKVDAPIEIIIEEETKSRSQDLSKANEKTPHNGQSTKHVTKAELAKQSSFPIIDAESQSEISQEMTKQKSAKDSGEHKSGLRRKSSRSRSSKRRISSRIKQQIMDYVGTTETAPQKEEVDKMTTASTTTTINITTTTPTITTTAPITTTIPTTTSTTIITIPTTTTTTTTTTTATTTTTTTTTITPPVIAPYKEQVEEQIDSKIFEKTESQTSEEVDTQTIYQHDTTYSKSLQDVNKSKHMERPFDYQITEDYDRNQKQHIDKPEEESGMESPDYTQNTRPMWDYEESSTARVFNEYDYVDDTSSENTNFTEDSRSVEDPRNVGTELMETLDTSEEKGTSVEESSPTEHETANDEFTAKVTNEEFEENLEEVTNKIPIFQEAVKISLTTENTSYQEESSFQENKNEKPSTPRDDLDKKEDSTITKEHDEMLNSEEELNEYQDMTESSAENAHDVNTQEDYKELENTEYSIMSTDYTTSYEYDNPPEDTVDLAERQETDSSTEGVLKFTDELPKWDYEESSTTRVFNEYDYVDDTYEAAMYENNEQTKYEQKKYEQEKHEWENDEQKNNKQKNCNQVDYKQLVFNITLDSFNEKSKPEKNNEEKLVVEDSNHERSPEADDNVEAKIQTDYIEFVPIIKVTANPITTSSTITATSTATASPTKITTESTTAPTTMSTTVSTTVPTTMSTTVSTTAPTTMSTTVSTTAPTTMSSTMSTTAPTTMSTTVSTTASTTESTAKSTMESTTASMTAYITASTIASTATSIPELTTVVVDSVHPYSTLSTTTTTTSTTTPSPTTTTSRSTPPKLFKPNFARRTYAYIPPTTTPVPVVIKPRLGLYNPKPAKPPKSYNELAPKPVIRKLPLLSRKTTTTTTTTTSTSNPIINTITDKSNQAQETTTTMTTTTTATTSMTTAMTTTTTTTTTTPESSKSEENILESKLEGKDHEFPPLDLSTKSDANKEDQLPSPSEQNSPVNSSKNPNFHMSTKEIQNFTPYPLIRLSTFAIATEQIAREAENKLHETTENIDILTTPILPTILPLEKSVHIETTTEMYPKEAETTTIASTRNAQDDINLGISSTISETTMVSASTTIPSKVVDAFFWQSNRKPTNPRQKHASFNCLEKDMYRFYGDARDCRLFHYCSPGFTKRQVLDFRFVCEEGTAFDEETESCRHDVRNRKCRNRSW